MAGLEFHQPKIVQDLDVVADVFEVPADQLREFRNRSRAADANRAQETQAWFGQCLSHGCDADEEDASSLDYFVSRTQCLHGIAELPNPRNQEGVRS